MGALGVGSSGTGLPAARSRTTCWSRSLSVVSGIEISLPSFRNVTSPSTSRTNSARIVRPAEFVHVRSAAAAATARTTQQRIQVHPKRHIVASLFAAGRYDEPDRFVTFGPRNELLQSPKGCR